MALFDERQRQTLFFSLKGDCFAFNICSPKQIFPSTSVPGCGAGQCGRKILTTAQGARRLQQRFDAGMKILMQIIVGDQAAGFLESRQGWREKRVLDVAALFEVQHGLFGPAEQHISQMVWKDGDFFKVAGDFFESARACPVPAGAAFGEKMFDDFLLASRQQRFLVWGIAKFHLTILLGFAEARAYFQDFLYQFFLFQPFEALGELAGTEGRHGAKVGDLDF